MKTLSKISTRNMPNEFRPFLWNILGFQEAYTFLKFLDGKNKILVLGETSGRDSNFLRAQGKQTFAVDIAISSSINRLVVADVTKPLPFPASFFDGVVMSEILEHLLEDLATLGEVRRVLASDGVLAISVPFHNDWPGIHLRLHSPSTITALLEYTGFVVDDLVERGAWLNWHIIIQLICSIIYHFGRLVGIVNDRDEVYLPILKMVADHNIRNRKGNAPWRLGPSYYGGYIKARKGQSRQFLHLQVGHFGDPNIQQAISNK